MLELVIKKPSTRSVEGFVNKYVNLIFFEIKNVRNKMNRFPLTHGNSVSIHLSSSFDLSLH